MSTQTEQDVLAKCKASFVAFLFVLWAALGLPAPTRSQIDMARKLESQDSRRFILQAFRGVGKSWITCAYVVWRLWRSPQMKIMMVSASSGRAENNLKFIRSIIAMLPFLNHLQPREKYHQDTITQYDVGVATPDPSPSVKAVGITGQLTGTRSDLIIGDDIEVTQNSDTQGKRDKLAEYVKEFDAVLKPEGTVLYLGTPQTEMTIYRELENRGYNTMIWPARYPADRKDLESYGGRLAPMLVTDLEKNPRLYGLPADSRFDDTDLNERALSYGKAGFALQFMLNPNLSDAERYPLKLRDLIVGMFPSDTAPMTLTWMPNRLNELPEAPLVGLTGDKYHRYEQMDTTVMPYTEKILVIDPSGRGKDETGYAVLYYLNGYIYLKEWGGIHGGYEDSTLEALALIAKKHKVHNVVIEGNFGDGMYLKLFTPVLLKVHRCGVEEITSKGMKEGRICDVLEPVMGSHKLVVDEQVIFDEYRSATTRDGEHNVIYSGFYQMTRITREKGALSHDDRLDALAIGVQYFVEAMDIDSGKGSQAALEEFLENHMEQELKVSGHTMMTVDDMEIRINDDEDDFGMTGSFIEGW